MRKKETLEYCNYCGTKREFKSRPCQKCGANIWVKKSREIAQKEDSSSYKEVDNNQLIKKIPVINNKTLAIFGIATYILSVIASATDVEGNSVTPIPLIVISGISTIVFIVMATIRLWKISKSASILLPSSFFVHLTLEIIQFITPLSYGSPLIILLNISKVIYWLARVWAILLLWAMGKHERLTKKYLKDSGKYLKDYGFTPKEISLMHDDLKRDKHQSVEQRFAVVQERQRAKYKESTGIDIRDIIPEIGQEISWADIVNHVFRVLEFDRNNTIIDQNNQVKAKSLFNPYGYLLVESPILSQKVRLPIIHRDDFLLAASVFDESKPTGFLVDEELLVTYSPKHLLPKGLSGSPHHVLHYAITPHGTIDSYYSMNNDKHMAIPDPQKIFCSFIYQGEIKVQIKSELKL